VKLIEHHAIVEFDEIDEVAKKEASSFAELLPPKVQRKLKELKVSNAFVEAAVHQEVKSLEDVQLSHPKQGSKVLLEKGQARLAEMLTVMSRSEALAKLKMTSGVSKKKKRGGKQKPSLKQKASAKQKPSLKLKPSVVAKAVKKQITKTAKGKFLLKVKTAKAKAKETVAEAKQLPGADKKDEEKADVQKLQSKLGKTVLCCSEIAGKALYGKTGTLKSCAADNCSVDFSPDGGVHPVKPEHLCSAKGTSKHDFKPKKQMQALNLLTRVLKQGFLTNIEDTELELPHKDGKWLLDWHITAAWSHMEWALWLKKAPSSKSYSYVDPLLSSAWYAVATEAHPDAGPEVIEAQGCREALLRELFEKDVVLCPIARQAAANHWTLLVVLKDVKEAHYFDSLAEESLCNRLQAEALLKEFSPALEMSARRNGAMQPSGSSTCGCFVLHWMEQTCRTLLLNESPCSLGWPDPKVIAERVLKVCKAIVQEKAASEADAEKAVIKDLKKLEKLKHHEAVSTKAAAGAKKAEELKIAAEGAFKKVPSTKPCRENLSPAAQAALKIVEDTGTGLCSKCRFESGCFMCHPDKALQYWLKKEFGHLL